ncbi:MAG: hypothetical protein FD127_900 [Acidimicrobiaceae bacterium]|nr:MAG: hypothetical protein FD127_900 [Acidimicrobiaceae bacterium]
MARLNIGVKVVLVALLMTALAFGDSERFSDKAMAARAVAYPLLCAVPGLIWWLARRRRPTLAYPHTADALVTMSFVVDLGGNALDLFDRLAWFDDAAHFTNWLLLGLALGITLRRDRPGWEIVWMVTGAGAVAAIAWEVAEYTSFVQTVEQLGIYRDTVGDICLGTSGAALAGIIAATLNRRRLAVASR